MPETELEREKDAAIGQLTDAYAQGGMDMAGFERAATRLSACGDSGSLDLEARALGLDMEALRAAIARSPEAHAPEARTTDAVSREAVQLECVSGSVRKVGTWVKSSLYRLGLKSSTARLDLREYEGAKGFRLVIEIAAQSSSVKLIVPEGFEVEDRFSERISSVVRNKPKGPSYGDNIVVLAGSLRSSTVRVRYR
jgi:hypothetical protein